MLKKAGIIVAAAATGVLAVSSFAFASESHGNLKNDCSFANTGGAPQGGATGGSSLVGDLLGAITSTATDATTQTNTGNCTNTQLKDLVKQGSDNRSKTETETTVKHSFNTKN